MICTLQQVDKGVDFNARNEYGLCMLDGGADVHAQNDYALLHASEYGHTQTV